MHSHFSLSLTFSSSFYRPEPAIMMISELISGQLDATLLLSTTVVYMCVLSVYVCVLYDSVLINIYVTTIYS